MFVIVRLKLAHSVFTAHAVLLAAIDVAEDVVLQAFKVQFHLASLLLFWVRRQGLVFGKVQRLHSKFYQLSDRFLLDHRGK